MRSIILVGAVASSLLAYEGNPRPQGHIKDGCYRAERRPSLSERGMLFSPRDFID